MKTWIMKLRFFIILLTVQGTYEPHVNAQPLLPFEVAVCQDFFGSLQNDNLPQIKKCLSIHPELLNSTNPEGLTPLQVAARNGQELVVKFLLKKNVQGYDTTPSGMNAFHLACNYGHTAVVRELLKNSNNINIPCSKGNYPIHYAARSGNFELVIYLIDQGADISQLAENQSSIVHWAALGGSLKILQYFVAKGFDSKNLDANGNNLLHWAARGNNTEMLHFLINDMGFSIYSFNNKNQCPLDLAMHCYQFETAKYLYTLQLNETPGQSLNKNLFHHAVSIGFYPLVNFLIENGIEVNGCNNKQQRPIHFASQAKNPACAKLLVSKGALINAKDSMGKTVLHLAIKYHNEEMVKWLLTQNIAINQTDNEGRTALHEAAITGFYEIIPLLVKSGALLTIQDNYGNTPNNYQQTQSFHKMELLNSLGSENATNKNIYNFKHVSLSL